MNSPSGPIGFQDDERVNRHGFAFRYDQGVDVDFGNLIVPHPKFSNADQGFYQNLFINSAFPPESIKQSGCFDFIDHLLRVFFGKGSEPETDVFQGLRKYATDAEHHTGSKLGIACEADDEFSVALHHFLNQNAFHMNSLIH